MSRKRKNVHNERASVTRTPEAGCPCRLLRCYAEKSEATLRELEGVLKRSSQVGGDGCWLPFPLPPEVSPNSRHRAPELDKKSPLEHQHDLLATNAIKHPGSSCVCLWMTT
jgi:hypothetical protein